MFLNETAVCERTDDRKYEWSSEDTKVIVSTLFKRSKRWSILSAFTTKDYIVWIIHHESITQKLFNDFVRYSVLSLCTRTIYDEINSVIICDNVKAHKSLEFRKMCLEADVELTFLSSYSSDYNSIKISFAMLKRWFKRNEHVTQTYDSLSEDFERFLKKTMLTQSQRADSDALFRASEYEYYA